MLCILENRPRSCPSQVALMLCLGMLLLSGTSTHAQSWYTPGPNCYPNRITGFTGTKNIYGYNEEGDLYAPAASGAVHDNNWRLSYRGSVRGLHFIDLSMEFAVGNDGALWRIDYKDPAYYVPIPNVTEADLYGICGWDYGYAGQYFAVGARGTILEYRRQTDSSWVISENLFPDLHAAAYVSTRGVFAVGDSGCIVVSTDRGSSWRRQDRNPLHFYSGIAVRGYHTVLLFGHDAATGNAILVRTDPKLQQWTEFQFPGHHAVRGMRFRDPVWCAFGDQGLLQVSLDSARNWKAPVHGTRFDFTDVMFSGWSMVAVGMSAVDGHFRSVVSSDSGKTWSAWLEAEDGLGAISLPRTSSYYAPLATEKGIVFSVESSPEYPMKAVLAVPCSLYCSAYLNYGIWLVGGEGGRIFRSLRDGRNWVGTEALTDDVIDMDVQRRSRVLALTRDSRIYRSVDSGATWQIHHVAPPGRSFRRIQCEQGDTCLAIGREWNSSAAWISVDGGLHWNTLLAYGGEITGIDIDSAGVVMVCTADAKLLRSTDFGVTWTVPLMRRDASFADVSIGSRTRIAVVERPDQVLYSSDAGRTWSVSRFPGKTFDRINAINAYWTAWGGANSILVGTNYNNNRLVTDRLVSTREDINAATSDSSSNIICVGEGGMVLLQTWTSSYRWDRKQVVSPVTVDLFDVTSWHSGQLLAVGDSGVILRGTKPGYTWDVMHHDPRGRSLTQVHAFPSGMAVAAGPEILLRTTTDGSGWVEERAFPGGRLAAVEPYGWYALQEDGAVYFTEDAGRSWELQSVLPHPPRECAGYDMERILVLCTDTSSGASVSFVYHSTDFGRTWEEVFRMPGTFDLLRIVEGCRVLLGGEGGTVFLSDNAGRTWTKTRSRFDVRFRDVVPVQIRSGFLHEFLFIANRRAMDILMLPNTVLAQADPPSIPDRPFISQVYPNPASALLQVEIAIHGHAPQRIVLHDLLGREMLEQHIEAGNSEISQATIDVARLSRGMYILRLTGEGVNDARLVQLQ